ncbi:MAG: glutamate synthase [Pseudomonadota bacterium]
MKTAEATIRSRLNLVRQVPRVQVMDRRTVEGGCGVIGVIGSKPLRGRSIIRSCEQMQNRGNGKGGGIAAVGLFDEWATRYAIHIAYLNEDARQEIEREFVFNQFKVAHTEKQQTIDDHLSVGLQIRPPTVWRYFVRVRSDVLQEFASTQRIQDETAAEDEFVFQNSFRLNAKYYAGQKDPAAFVLSHGRNLMILKGVGFAEQIARYYCLEDVSAHVWIGHQRYPTRGRVWHPGGAHPFAGLHEALVHNGDFANYHAITEYLRQRGIVPLFVTDTEVSVLLFDFYSRVLGYPLEFVIEALAPTPEGDFERLSKQRQKIYRAIQTSHLHGSPDGPWFFIVARTEPNTGAPQLIGITDVSMLRPQVFALQAGIKSFGAIASEKQALDAFFEEIAAEDPDASAQADRYWNARGGSCTDGGAFSFTLQDVNGRPMLDVRDKFGNEISVGPTAQRIDGSPLTRVGLATSTSSIETIPSQDEKTLEARLRDFLRRQDFQSFFYEATELGRSSGPEGWRKILATLSFLRDRRWDPEGQQRSRILSAIDTGLIKALDVIPGRAAFENKTCALRLDRSTAWKNVVPPPRRAEDTLVVNARGFPPEGPESVSRLLVVAKERGWRNFVLYRLCGDRFIGCGLGPKSDLVSIDLYGSSGDYLGSGLDGAQIFVHGDAQDQVGQILKSGRIVIFGNVGQTFLYGAKGGEAFIMGSAAGRPLINAVGHVRATINGTCLDYCAESFMAGEQLGGGFVIINGLDFNQRGEIVGLEMKYPGNNLFSLASGGACYLNDPYNTVSEAQLNSASFVPFRQDDWNVILPYLKINEELFGISIRNDLLLVDGVLKWPKEVFRKIVSSTETKNLDWSSLPA